MSKKTSIHICPAKYGAEKHNRREKEMKHVHKEYSYLNKSWEMDGFKSVADEIRKAKDRYSKMHFCRKAVLDENGNKVWVTDETKSKKMPKNAIPIREGVAVITEDTSMEQMKSVAFKIEKRWGIKTIGIWAHLDEGHEHLVTDKDHQQGKYLDTKEGNNVFLWNHHAHFLFDWTDHKTGQCIVLKRHDMSELQDMLANTFRMERGKKSAKKWRDAQSFKADQEAIRAKEVSEYADRKLEEVKLADKEIEKKKGTMAKLQAAIDELLSVTNMPEEKLEVDSYAEMTFCRNGDDDTRLTIKNLIDDASKRIDEEVGKPIPMVNRKEWQKECNAKNKKIITQLQNDLIAISNLHKQQILKVGKAMYLDAKQKSAMAIKIEQENAKLKQRISELDENAVAREKSRADAAEHKAKDLAVRANREEQRACEAESQLSKMECFIRQAGALGAFEDWNRLCGFVEEAARALADWAQSTKNIFTSKDEQVIGRGIIAKCQLEELDPSSETDRLKAASGIADMADSIVGDISKFSWEVAVRRIGQLASEICIPNQSQSIGGTNGCADELTNWDGSKKRGLGR